MILTQTRDRRRSLGRHAVGSFTEALFLESPVPVLAMRAEMRPARLPRQILFPTEFGPHSEQVFEQVVRLAASLGASITGMHVLQLARNTSLLRNLSMAGSASGNIPMQAPNVPRLLKERQLAAQRTFAQWSRKCRRHGVRADFLIMAVRGDVAGAILRSIPKVDADLLAIEAESGRWRSALLGSVCQRLVRAAPCPAWVIRARARRHAPHYLETQGGVGSGPARKAA